ncbi:MAG: gamma-glutamyltransferase, partial [Acidobacteriota bacterium]
MLRTKTIINGLIIVSLVIFTGTTITPQEPSQPVEATHGMVVSTNRLASEVGVEILKKGGNAVDAAVATAFALAVTHPSAGNIGGGGFMLIRWADTGKAVLVDYREEAPGRAERDMYLDE